MIQPSTPEPTQLEDRRRFFILQRRPYSTPACSMKKRDIVQRLEDIAFFSYSRGSCIIPTLLGFGPKRQNRQWGDDGH